MAQAFLEIEAETNLSFDIKYKGTSYLLRLDGGEWRLWKDGGAIANLGRARMWSFRALSAALDYLSAGSDP